MKKAYKTILTLSLLCHVFAAEPEYNTTPNLPKAANTEDLDSFFENFVTFKKPSTQNEWLDFGKRYLEFELAQEELDEISKEPLPEPIKKEEFKNKAILERSQKQVRKKGQCYSLLPASEQSKQHYGLFNIQDLLLRFNSYQKPYYSAKRSIEEKLCFFPKIMTGEPSDITFGYAFKDPIDLRESSVIKVVKHGFLENELDLTSLFEDFSNFQKKLMLLRVSSGLFNFLKIVIFPSIDWNKIQDEVRSYSVSFATTGNDFEELFDLALSENQKSKSAAKIAFSQIAGECLPDITSVLDEGGLTTLIMGKDNNHDTALLEINEVLHNLEPEKHLFDQFEALKSLNEELAKDSDSFCSKDFSAKGRAYEVIEKFRAAFDLKEKLPTPDKKFLDMLKSDLQPEGYKELVNKIYALFYESNDSVSHAQKINAIVSRYTDIYFETGINPFAMFDLDRFHFFSESATHKSKGFIFEDMAKLLFAAKEKYDGLNKKKTIKKTTPAYLNSATSKSMRIELANGELSILEKALSSSRQKIIRKFAANKEQDKILKGLRLAYTKHLLEAVVFETLSFKLPEFISAIQQFRDSFTDQIPTLKEEIKQRLAASSLKKKVGQAVLECPAKESLNPVGEPIHGAQKEIIQIKESMPEPEHTSEQSVLAEQAQPTLEVESISSHQIYQEEMAEQVSLQPDIREALQNTVSAPSLELEEQKQLNEKLRTDLSQARIEFEQLHSQLLDEQNVSASTSKQYLEVTQELSKLEAEKAELQKNFSELEAELRSVKEKASQRELETTAKMTEYTRSIASLSRVINDLKQENAVKIILEAENSKLKDRITELEEITKTRLSKNKEKQKELKKTSEELERMQGQMRLQELFLKAAQEELSNKIIKAEEQSEVISNLSSLLTARHSQLAFLRGESLKLRNQMQAIMDQADKLQEGNQETLHSQMIENSITDKALLLDKLQELLVEKYTLEENNRSLSIENTSLNFILQDPDSALSKFEQFIGEERFSDFLKFLEQSDPKENQ